MERLQAERNQATLERVRATRQAAPCVSIYLNKPDPRLSGETASIALYRELAYARRLLETSWPRQKAAGYLKPLLRAAKDELLRDGQGCLALFHSGDTTSCVRLAEAEQTRTVVADDFHVKPLIKQEQQPQSQSLEWALTLCRQALSEGRAATGLHQVAQVLKAGRAHCLWVAEDVSIWGLLNRKHGSIVIHPRQMNERDGDLLDDLLEWALDLGIEVHVLPRHQIPGQHPVIAET